MIFPDQTIQNSLIIGYVFLAIGFLSRPAGAVLFGYIGDSYGRKQAMIVAIILMASSTTLMGLLPTGIGNIYITLSLLALCRVMQGLSAGGEYSGAGLLLVENSQKQSQYLKGAILTSSGLLGAFMAATAAALLNLPMFSFISWRVLFLFGGLLKAVGLWLRLSIEDTHQQVTMIQKPSLSWHLLLTEYKWSFICTILIGGLMNVPFQMVTCFINTYFFSLGI